MDNEAYGGPKGQAPRNSSEARLQETGRQEDLGVGAGAAGIRAHAGLTQASASRKATDALKHHH